MEGRQAVRELLAAGRRKVHEVLVEDDSADGPADIIEMAADLRINVKVVGRGRLGSIARTEAPQGVVAKAAPLPEASVEDVASTRGRAAPFLVAADGVTDPGNLGALLRSAECAGASGVVLPRHRSAHVTPAAAKAAAGAIEHLDFCVVGGLPAGLAQLRDLGVWIVGLDAGGQRSMFEAQLPADEPICIVLGSEGRGLSRLVKQRCHEVVRLPMVGSLASLNVAAAGAIACYEIARRREAV